MKTYECSYYILDCVICKHYAFKDALKEVFKCSNPKKEDVKDIISLSLGVLKHYLVLNDRVNECLKIDKKTILLASYICAYCAVINKKTSFDEMVNYALEEIKKYSKDLKEEDIKDYFYTLNKTSFLEKYIKDFSLGNESLMANIPYWIIRMIGKQYKHRLALQMTKSLKKDYVPTYVANEALINKDRLMNEYHFYNQHPYSLLFADKEYKESIKDALNNHYAFEFNMLEDDVIKHLDIDLFKKIAIYQDYISNIYMYLYFSFKENTQLQIMTASHMVYDKISAFLHERMDKDQIKYPVCSLHLEMCEDYFYDVNLSSQVDYFFFMPSSSSFSNLNKYPEFFLKCDKNNLDKYIGNIYKGMENADKFVALGGSLIIIIPTISMKETHLNVEKFLTNHQNYIKVYERQILPFDKCHYIGYAAILVKHHD